MEERMQCLHFPNPVKFANDQKSSQWYKQELNTNIWRLSLLPEHQINSSSVFHFFVAS